MWTWEDRGHLYGVFVVVRLMHAALSTFESNLLADLCAVLSSGAMRALDTSPEAAAIQEEAHRRVGLHGRLQIALDLSDLAHAFAVAGIRRREPGLSDDQAREKLAGLLYEQRSVLR